MFTIVLPVPSPAIFVRAQAVRDSAVRSAYRVERRGVDSVLHFGARIGQDKIGQDKPIDAHAWLDAAGVEVTGYPVANTFAEIACFV